MASSQLTLEVLIQTVLDGAGVKASKAEMQALAATIEKTAAAGKQLEITNDSIVEGLNRQRAAAASAAKGWEQMGEAEKASARETAQRAVRLIEAEEATKAAAKGAQNLSKDLGSLKMAGAGVQQVIGGALQGNLIAAGQGFATLGKAAETASAPIRTLFAQLARGGAAGAAIGAPIVILSLAMKQLADDVEKANQRILDSARDTSEKRKKILEQETAAIVAEYAKQAKAAEAAGAAAEESQKRTTEAYDRAEKKTERDRLQRDSKLDIAERQALAKAKTPAEKEKISRSFARQRDANKSADQLADFNTAGFEAGVQTDKARAAQAAARASNDEAEAGIRDAERDLENKKAIAKQYAKPVETIQRGRHGEVLGRSYAVDTDPNAVAAHKAVFDAEAKLKTTRQEAAGVFSKNSDIIKQNQAIIDQAEDTKKLVEIQREILKATLAQNAAEKNAKGATLEDRKDAAATNDTLATDGTAATGATNKPRPGSGGTISKNGQSIEVRGEKAVAELAKTGEVLGKTMTAIENYSTTVARRAEKTQAKLTATKEGTAGG